MGAIRFLFRAVACVAVGLVMLVLLGIPLGTWIYLHLNAARAEATVLEKSEYVYYKRGGGWKLYLRLRVRYSPVDTRNPEASTIDVDEDTWEQSKAGARVEIAYVPVAALRQFPLATAARLGAPLRPVSREPEERRSGQAVVRKIRHISRVGGGSRSRSMPAWQPFDVVEFDFVPAGKTETLRAVDSVDAGSGPDLAAGKAVAIEYSSRRPRVAKIAGASRDHEWKNEVETWAFPGILVVLVSIFLIRRAGKSKLSRATR